MKSMWSLLLVWLACGCSATERDETLVVLAARTLDGIRVTNDTALEWTDCRAELVGGCVLVEPFDLKPRATASIRYQDFRAIDASVDLNRRDGYARAGNGITIKCYGSDNFFHTARLQ